MEASLTLLQDRNMFWVNGNKCQSCNNAPRNVDHVATRCKRLVAHNYKRRHDEVLKCIALKMLRKYNLANTKRSRNVKIGETFENEKAKIFIDKHIKVERYCKHDKPDLLVIDKINRIGLIIEIGISSAHEIEHAENEKSQKYLELAEQPELIHCLKETYVIPIVFTWEGHIRMRSAKSLKYLDISKSELAYIQTRILKRTLETMTEEEKRFQKAA